MSRYLCINNFRVSEQVEASEAKIYEMFFKRWTEGDGTHETYVFVNNTGSVHYISGEDLRNHFVQEDSVPIFESI
jgi:hypothetical protein